MFLVSVAFSILKFMLGQVPGLSGRTGSCVILNAWPSFHLRPCTVPKMGPKPSRPFGVAVLVRWQPKLVQICKMVSVLTHRD